MTFTHHLLSRNTIAVKAKAADWKEAVRIGTDLLVKAGTIEPRYYDAIINQTEELGPYYLLAPGLAMPHGRPEEGVLENSFALVTLETPVNFGDQYNDPIEILITLAATDAKTQNEEAIVQVVTIFDDDEVVEKLRSATTVEEVRTLLETIQE